MSKRTVIVSGGILEKEFVLPILQSEETEFIIGVDKGLQFLYENEIKPDYIVGDFDSVPREIVEYYRTEENVPIREFNPVKDASDTEIALRLCLGLRRKEIYILGGTGNRIDHLWANIQCLNIALAAGSEAMILDSHNRIRILEHGITTYRSFFPFTILHLTSCFLGFFQNHTSSSDWISEPCSTRITSRIPASIARISSFLNLSCCWQTFPHSSCRFCFRSMMSRGLSRLI